MRTFDFTPLRGQASASTICSIFSTTPSYEDQGGYPPYDIVRTGEDSYRIAVAIAGFTPEEITVPASRIS